MKNNENLTIAELIDWIKNTGREMTGADISNRNMPNMINRSKAVALLTKAALNAADYARKNGANLENQKIEASLNDKPKGKLIK